MDIMLDDNIRDGNMTATKNIIAPALHDPSATRVANDLHTTTSHEGHLRAHHLDVDVQDFGFLDEIVHLALATTQEIS